MKPEDNANSSTAEQLQAEILAAALGYAKKGLPIFPCKPKDKRPYTDHGFKDASSDPQIIQDWWGRWPDALIGLSTGRASGIFALDVDLGHKEGENGLESLSALEAANSPLPETKRTRTPSGGLHYLFRHPVGMKIGNSAGKLGLGLDTRGDGGYVIFPPSRTAKGKYSFENPQTPLAEIPDWLLKLLAPPAAPKQKQLTPPVQTSGLLAYVRTAIEGELNRLAASPSGTRNDALNRASFALGQWVGGGALSEDEAECLLFQAAQSCGLVADDGENSVRKTIGSGFSRGKDNPRSVPASAKKACSNSVDVVPAGEDGQESEETRILPPPPPVPLEVFPAAVRAILEEAAEAFACPVQIPTTCLLGVLSCLVGGTRLISLRPSWREPGNIWIATVAASGIGKTPCAAAFFSPVKRLEYEAFRQWREEYTAYENELDFYRKERQKAKRGDPIPDKPIQPKRRQAYVDDATVEALGEVLSENPRGIMWRRDELSGIIADMDKYSSGNSGGGTRSRLLSSYDGQEWKTSRTSNPTRNLYIPHAYVGIFGGIQPAMLPKVFEAGASGVDEASGFLQRFMLIRAEREKPGYWTERYLSQPSKDLLTSIAAALWTWDIEYDAEGREVEKIVTASSQAKSVFIEWFNRIAQEEFLSQNAALLSKLKGQAQRLCLLLHCLDAALVGNDGMNPVTEDTMRRALLLADWVKEHQVQCWRFFAAEQGAKQADPIERAIMQVVVEEYARIEAAGWRISNADLLTLVQSKLKMPGLSAVKIGRAASGLGLAACSVNKGDRGRTVTKEKIVEFKATVGTVGTVGKHCGTTGRSVADTVGQPSATVGVNFPDPGLPTVADSTPTVDVLPELLAAQELPTHPTVPTVPQEQPPKFDFDDPNFPDEVRI
ncbi:MAG: DUF3987 domain-containing protein [Desulfovibrio sp.]|jgi:hypothetical protein|nr:DUF3987 domain-containing protein [Desulfovibrio sp.]